jgi:hypothetical protein
MRHPWDARDHTRVPALSRQHTALSGQYTALSRPHMSRCGSELQEILRQAARKRRRNSPVGAHRTAAAPLEASLLLPSGRPGAERVLVYSPPEIVMRPPPRGHREPRVYPEQCGTWSCSCRPPKGTVRNNDRSAQQLCDLEQVLTVQ